MCCTANFNQGWPRFIQHMLHASSDGGLAVSSLGPVSATLPSGVSVNVTGDYPFDDNVTIALAGLPAGALTFPLYVRVPSWATAATLSVNGAAPVSVGSANGTMLKVAWGGADAGPTASVTLFTNPAVRVAPAFNGALAVFRGALLYSLRLDENFVPTTSAPGESRAVDYVVEQPGCDDPNKSGCAGFWNAALIVDDPAHPESAFRFSRVGAVPPVPFAAGLWGASNLELTAQVRQVQAWGVELGAAAPPPASPVDCSGSGACSAPYVATFVPYGATHLRMAELPWTSRPPCGTTVGYNASGSTIAGGASSFDTYAGASITGNGPDMNIRSGDPGDVSTAAWDSTVVDAAHSIAGVSFSFQYVSGYGPDGAPNSATLELLALAPGPCGVGGAVVATLYTSPELSHFSYDKCNTCYSPPIVVNAPAPSINATEGIVFALRFTDNQRNVQLKLPIPLTVHWAS